MILGVCGLIGSGKNATADYLKERGFQLLSFATPLKDVTATLFNWDREMLEGATPEARAAREALDPYWTERLGRDWSGRIALQIIGSEVFRNGLSPEIWVYLLEKKLVDNPDTNFVISDCRFPNEIAILRKHGAKIWWIRRGELPSWWMFARINEMRNGGVYAMEQLHPEVHISEWAWCNTEFDLMIENDQDLKYLYKCIEKAIK